MLNNMSIADWRAIYSVSASLCIPGFLAMTVTSVDLHIISMQQPRPYWFIGLALFLVGIILFYFPPVRGHRFTQEKETRIYFEIIFLLMVMVFVTFSCVIHGNIII